MSSYDKVVKLACKPKAAPPKAKYIDPIIAATWSDDGAVHDVCKALSPRLREPNAIVAFKALIVLHTMIRNGATDNVLSYLSSSEILRLRNITAGNWEGYVAPQNLQNYALYLDSRIRAYKDLKHDAVRVQAESNRDMRNSQSIEEDGYRGRKDRPIKASASAPARSKTIMGRKLRSMTVEKGLLRETRAVHGMIDALVECRFYLDDLEDELTITALRMLVKDLLILFQAGNEGVINVLEHYFEMSHIDATEALKLYRHFCKQTECVVEYLGVAKKLQNLLNVSIPNLKHAPVSLAGALQEYLDDANFEQNRIEYKTNKAATEGGSKSSTNGKQTKSATVNGKPTEASSSKVTPKAETSKVGDDKDAIDFFSSIDESQPTMFNPQTNSPSTAYFHQQASNPFGQMLTGQPFMQQPAQLSFQPTGFTPQQPNPFASFLSPQVPQPTGHRPFSSYLPPQTTGFVQQQPTQHSQPGILQQQQVQNPQQAHTLQPQPPQPTGFVQSETQTQQSQPAGFLLPQTQQPQQMGFLRPQQSGFLQPQATGANPFRQSMLMPQSTGMALFGGSSQTPSFGTQASNIQSSQLSMLSPNAAASGASAFSSLGSGPATSSSFVAPTPSIFGSTGTSNTPARPASTPLTSTGSALSSTPQPVKSHQTGTKNPFGPITVPPPPVPKQPTLFELSSTSIFNANTNQPNFQPNQSFSQAQQQQPQATGFSNGFNFNNSSLNPGAADISSVASSFAFSTSKPKTATTSTTSFTGSPTTATGSTYTDSLFSSTLSTQPTGATNTSTSPSMQLSSATSVKPQMTGFSGLKPFKPSSSFGASLMESLPTIPGSAPTTPSVSGLPSISGPSSPAGGNTFSSTPTSPANGVTGNYAFLNTQLTGATGGFGSAFGSSLGVGLRPQMTGGGSANPFRASMAAGGGSGGGVASFASFQPSPAINFGSSQPFNTGMQGNQQHQQQQQQSATNSLI